MKWIKSTWDNFIGLLMLLGLTLLASGGFLMCMLPFVFAFALCSLPFVAIVWIFHIIFN